MDSKETHQQQQQDRDAAALADPTSTSQAMHTRSSAGALSPRQPQPQPPMLDASVATQPQWRQLGTEQRGRGRPRRTERRGRGRPRKYAPPADVIDGTNALGGGEEGGALRVHVIDVNAGEDIAMKILEFINQEPRDVFILSASGEVSSVAIHTNMNRVGLVMFEGRYVIIRMSMSSISYKTEKRTASLHVSLAGPDCKVVGGCVAEMLVAASQVKVIVGTFGPERGKLSAGSSESSEENGSKSPVGNPTPQPPQLSPANNPQ